jgi:hypothetical protein
MQLLNSKHHALLPDFASAFGLQLNRIWNAIHNPRGLSASEH